MKLSQDLVVLDLEATSSTSPEGFQRNDWIIQIAAVYLKRDEDNKKYIKHGEFNSLVKPKEEISPYIENLTGISNDMVAKADEFSLVGEKFKSWVAEKGNIKTLRMCAWGTYFDIPLLRRNYEYYNNMYPFSGTAYDIKTYASLWAMLSGRRLDKLRVEHVMNLMGIKPVGKYHDALTDAHAEADILLRIFDDLNGGVFLEDSSKGQNRLLKIIG